MIVDRSQPIGSSVTEPKILQMYPHVVLAFTDTKHQCIKLPITQTEGAGFAAPNCRVFDVYNFFIAATAVFPSSGYGNSKFLAMVLCYRFSKKYSWKLSNLRQPMLNPDLFQRIRFSYGAKFSCARG
jgi:hypothetical protein